MEFKRNGDDDKGRAKHHYNKRTAQWWAQAQLRVAARCRQRSRPPRRRSVRTVRARKVRQELRARTREGLEPQVNVALFFRAAHVCFHGADVQPVMLGATCYIASAKDGAPCNRLGRVRKKKLGGPATFTSLQKKMTVTTSLEITSNQPTSWKGSNSCSEKGFTSHPVLIGLVTALADGAVEEMTRWSDDPPLDTEHATVLRESRFPTAIRLWACRGWKKITSINSLTNGNKLAGRRTVPVFGAECGFQVVPGPAQKPQRFARRGARNM